MNRYWSRSICWSIPWNRHSGRQFTWSAYILSWTASCNMTHQWRNLLIVLEMIFRPFKQILERRLYSSFNISCRRSTTAPQPDGSKWKKAFDFKFIIIRILFMGFGETISRLKSHQLKRGIRTERYGRSKIGKHKVQLVAKNLPNTESLSPRGIFTGTT